MKFFWFFCMYAKMSQMGDAIGALMMMKMMNQMYPEKKSYRRKAKKKQKKFWTNEQKIAYYNANPWKWQKKLPYLIAQGRATAGENPASFYARQGTTTGGGNQSGVDSAVMPMNQKTG